MNITPLDLDIIIKIPNSTPFQNPRFRKAVLFLNYNPAIAEKKELFYPLQASFSFFPQSAKILKSSKSFSSFSIRKGMQRSIISTIHNPRGIHFSYLSFIFFFLPLASSHSSLSVFHKVSPNGDYSSGIVLPPSFHANISYIIGSDSKFASKLFFSYFLFPTV